MAKVLVIDDDKSLLRAMQLGLKAGGHNVITAETGENGITQTALHSPDVVILDLGLPDMDGSIVCARIRQWSDVPIIILSAAGAESRKIAALDGGANDYVTKPFSMGELEARIRVVVRNRHSEVRGGQETTITCGPLVVDLIHHEAALNDEWITLTSKEFEVLAYLARHAGRTCTHQMILGAVWGIGFGEEAHYVHAYIHRLRHKLHDESGQLIRTIPGVGYSIENEVEPLAT